VRIVHIGIGNFARAHQAWYTATADGAGEWGISGFTGRRPDIANALAPQQGLYTLIQRGATEDKLTVIDAVQQVRTGTDLGALTEAVADPLTAVVTVTVTEAGYGPASDPQASALGRLTLALAARRHAQSGALAIVSCDNLHANGSVLRARILALSEQLETGLADWVDGEIAFVSTSVDRITPATTDRDVQLVERALGLVDAAPVVCEPFSDWVLSGDFPAGRPPWEAAGARFVSELDPWELRKLWLLNGGHSLLAYLGLLRGHETVADAFADPDLELALDQFWDLAQRLLPAADLDLPAYRRQLRERFANARIGYPLAQIAGDGLDKLRNRVVPVIEAARAGGVAAEPAIRIVDAWTQWLIGDPDRVRSDQNAELLQGVLDSGGGDDQARALLQLLAPACFSKRPPISEERP
jgi:fructuronate reductase